MLNDEFVFCIFFGLRVTIDHLVHVTLFLVRCCVVAVLRELNFTK